MFTLLIILIIVLFVLVDQSVGFGAGNIPSYAYLEDKAFRHGDIESVPQNSNRWLKKLVVVFWEALQQKVYFGNWLRDYSQAMDVAGLSKLARQTIINLVMALGFLAHGYATGEFEVTEERLGVYLPVEHIDNPKGYNDGKDARAVHPQLRGPIDPQELQIDPRTGIKNYIANEDGNWDTSSACVRRILLKCIEMGRRAKNSGEKDLHEAYRLLGTALHTLEDLTAHSNWCELSLRRLGHSQVFCHVGDACLVDTPSGKAPPLITGVFGSADFLHSLLGEATDHISEASVSDLSKAMSTARSSPGSDPSGDALRELLFQIPSGGGSGLSREMDDLSEIRGRTAPGSSFDPANMSPQELHATLWKVLKFRDDVCKSIENTLEKIPGLSALTEKIGNAVNKFVFTTLEPIKLRYSYLKPIMQSATSTLQTGSAAVINKQEQYEVFDNPYADDPTHSILSKDHFGLILNEPAGNLAKIIVKHAVKGVVQAWDSTSVDPHQVVAKILEAFHHPYFVDGSSDVQREMGAYMRDWIGKMSDDDRRYVLNALSKDSVRNGKNKRRGHVDDGQQGCCGNHGSSTFGQHMQGLAVSYNSIQGLMGGVNRDVHEDSYNMPDRQDSYNMPDRQDSYSRHGHQESYSASHRQETFSMPSHQNSSISHRQDTYSMPSHHNSSTSNRQDTYSMPNRWDQNRYDTSDSDCRQNIPYNTRPQPSSSSWNTAEERRPPPQSWDQPNPSNQHPSQKRYPPGGY
ncbi:heterokaryon incompatibility protein Het-C-domain-containing protein [Phakopsora pachyrhizi]|uniref:Heterokaryon incompatibility protein Het-C-domain-containing protein n=1 Tax=Phakopsora pachyrhizi TaxID=170000 RepID=A0AAV0APE3_PHAPC|nr:heterokaryon incompatibility protein Het-C-domain-containing protein [Phakopsora pachyrhizi]